MKTQKRASDRCTRRKLRSPGHRHEWRRTDARRRQAYGRVNEALLGGIWQFPPSSLADDLTAILKIVNLKKSKDFRAFCWSG